MFNRLLMKIPPPQPSPSRGEGEGEGDKAIFNINLRDIFLRFLKGRRS